MSCEKRITLEERVASIEKSDFQIFENIHLQARYFKDGKYRAGFFDKQIDGKRYLLPNFHYFGCESGDTICLRKFTIKKINLKEFGYANGYKDTDEAYPITVEYIEKVMKEYDKIKIYKISSNESLGGGIIFYYEEDNYVAYIPDLSKVENENWKKRFTEENKIKDKWYKGNW